MAGNNSQFSPLSSKKTTMLCIRGSQMGLMRHDVVLTWSEVELWLLRQRSGSAEMKVTEVCVYVCSPWSTFSSAVGHYANMAHVVTFMQEDGQQRREVKGGIMQDRCVCVCVRELTAWTEDRWDPVSSRIETVNEGLQGLITVRKTFKSCV